MSVRIESIKPHIGGIIHVERSRVTDDDVVAAVKQALEECGVLVIPQAHLTDEEQLAFTDKLGERVTFTRRVPGGEGSEDKPYEITLDKKINREPEYVLGTFFWHIDGVTIDQPLPKATMLSARKLSPSGGQTEFASTYAAWEELPEDEKRAIEDLKVIHRMEASMRPVFKELDEDMLAKYRGMAVEMVQPLVWKHKSGRKSLVIGSHADEIIGMSVPAGRALLVRLQEWAAQPAFSYRHPWQEGDFVIWNNQGVMHRVIPYDENSGRMMHRTTIMGQERLGVPLTQYSQAA